jgi:2-polyprenyl-3-methyl-5-hydroxy-6-metoxy-1,4-benzoquinol methylase
MHANPHAGVLVRLRDTILEQTFLFLRRFKPVRERVTLGELDDRVEREHVARYEFAKQFCMGKDVADIACGTGYGTTILRQVAASVNGYDKQLLCGNRTIDLEKECWEKTFDVIVSFETIEHLANPEFFLENARRTAKLLVVSSPIGEFRGYNPHHKQVWDLPQFKTLLAKYFRCSYFFQEAESIQGTPFAKTRFVIAVGTPN